MHIYLDYAAATPLDIEVLQTMQSFLTDRFYNPSAQYLAAQSVRKEIEEARERVAFWFGARPTEVIFTAGGTEANNLAIRGVMDGHDDGNVVVSAIEHEAVIKPASEYNYKKVAVDPSGILDLKALEKHINDKTVLVSIMYANNEIGTMQPLRQVGLLINKIKTERRKVGNNYPLYFHTDACQAANYLDLHASRLGTDLITINSGKIYGPKQCGALYVKAGTNLKPQILGGGQERGFRSGTENVANIIGFAAALDIVQSKRADEISRLQKLQNLFFELVEQLPGATVNGSRKHRLPNNIHISLEGQDNERLMMLLDEQGILCATGSACSASKEESSHVLKAIGLTDEQAYGSLRFSMGMGTSELKVRQTVQALAALLTR